LELRPLLYWGRYIRATDVSEMWAPPHDKVPSRKTTFETTGSTNHEDVRN
jgi:hypothetical protein